MATIVGVLFLITLTGTVFTQSCSETNRNNNLSACLTDIRTVARDNVRFWFGSSYNDNCPDGRVLTDPECALFTGLEIPQSIASLIYPDGNFDPSKLDRYLDVKYTSSPGNYSGCDNEYIINNTVRFTADPLSMTTINCWDARESPEVSWTSENGQLYSLIAVDAAYNVIHAIYVNIAGNDIANADVIKGYVGPLQPSRFGNAYVFFLFKQSGRVVPILRYRTLDLIAMNWILAAGDPYTIGRNRESGLVDNCPSFVADKIKTQGRSFIPDNPKFEVGVYLTYRSEAMDFFSCCKSFSLEAKNTTLNPLGDIWVKTGDVRNVPEVKLIRTALNFKQATGFEGKRYTLMMLDPAKALLRFGSADEPFIYWMVTNIKGGDVTSGDTILPYIGIEPFDDVAHQYYFLLYEQGGNTSSVPLTLYTSVKCTGILQFRCRFRITQYVSDNSLKLVGATWMRSKNDDFVPYARVQLGAQETVVCDGVTGYFPGCNACSEESRQTDLATCLAAIGSLAQDTFRYGFGSSYNQRCPNGYVLTEPECTKPPSLMIPQSIISLTYPPGVFKPSTLDRFLDVKYTSIPGKFSSCGNEYFSEATTHFTANPLSMETIDCWDARDMPEISWRTESNQLYSLVMYDVGFQFLHACYLNIQGNDIKNSDVISPYLGPGTILRVGGVYAFYLFAQESRTLPDPRFSNRGGFNMTEFMQVQNLKGPVAINWIIASHDLYASFRLNRAGLVDTCPTFVADAITEPGRPFLPEQPKFDVGVYVTYHSSQFKYRSCCTSYLLPAANVSLNPLGHGLVKPGEARSVPTVTLTRTLPYFNASTGFNGKIYTLIMVDSDIVYPELATSEKPFVHWLVTNIRNGDVTSGDEALSYLGPGPMNDADHYYYFLVYEQSGTIKATAPVSYTSDACPEAHANRCVFEIAKYVSLNNLKLVGASWMVSRKDEFVRHFRVTAGGSKSSICEGVPGYSTDCLDYGSGSQVLQLPIRTLFSAYILGILMHL